VLHRQRTLPYLILDGRFTRQQLAQMAWQDRDEADQRVLLGMMESCGICFRLRDLSNDSANPEWLYAARTCCPNGTRPGAGCCSAGFKGRRPTPPCA